MSGRAASLLVGATGLVLCAVGLVFDPGAVLRGWLAAFAFWIGLPLGALMLLLAHDLTGGRWGRAAREPLRATAATMPLLAVCLLPILFALPQLYPWARPEEAANLKNLFYLNAPFFVGRALVFVGLWSLLSLVAAWRAAAVPAPVAVTGLILLALTATLAAFDWTMSLEPDWGSSIYGMMVISGHLLAALALATLVAVVAGPAGEGERMDLGSLLIAGLLLWFYLSFMQFLIIWEEDLPKEITWYVARLAGGWGWVAVLGALGQGALPFFALIWWPVKRSRVGLGTVCALLLASHLLECWWLVLPGTPGGWTWFAPAATLAIGGFWAALFLGRLEVARRQSAVEAADAAGLLGEARHG
ncbi:hypothetical protein [Azospirillum rugosum]|uniref:Quinol:cytochrome c oxidoreductase quinone-binding subunit 2 n=1 Tax=Azospirillum rugosum TaxID=416170 RepID=A0ABS4SKK7_9PROT|nr:hypothetical protein [Azospirillum rugosum]MBP2292628.1 hypothetical protein [Azospirillum rugosum]MDQ0526348.1 hypothetical protein [Azospirillum rugosum]